MSFLPPLRLVAVVRRVPLQDFVRLPGQPLVSFPQTCEIPPVVGKLPFCFRSTPDERTVNNSAAGHTSGSVCFLRWSASVLLAAAAPSRRPALHLLWRQVAKVAAVPSLRLSPPVRSGVVHAGAYMPW